MPLNPEIRPWRIRQFAPMAGLAASLVLAACGRGGEDWRQTAPAQASGDQQQSGYVRPPKLLAAMSTADGGWTLSGQAEPQVRVRLASPAGDAYGATADAKGRWSITLPAQAAVQLFGLSEDQGGRMVQSEGYIALTPRPRPLAVNLRAGVGAAPITVAPAAPKIVAIDCDAAGGSLISGLAQPGASLHLSVDDVAAGDARADGAGRFSIALATTLKPGRHRAVVQAGATVVSADFVIDMAPTIEGLPFRGRRQADRWRIDWITPGGGVQTTYILD